MFFICQTTLISAAMGNKNIKLQRKIPPLQLLPLSRDSKRKQKNWHHVIGRKILEDQNPDLLEEKQHPPTPHTLVIIKILCITALPKRPGFLSEPPGSSTTEGPVYSPWCKYAARGSERVCTTDLRGQAGVVRSDRRVCMYAHWKCHAKPPLLALAALFQNASLP